MSKTILCVPDPHAHFEHDNNRADYLAYLILDMKPDIVLCAGDLFDMPSLSSYEKGKRSFVGKSYKKDIEAGLEFHDRMWGPVKAAKKKLPRRVILEGNHEHRIERALDLSPELAGTIGFKDYDFDHYYDEVIRYDGGLPGVTEIEGILFAHFFPTGIMGRPIGGERPAHMLIHKNGVSSVQFHSHILDFATRRNVAGKVTNGLVGGCYQNYINDWAGPIGKFWRAGVSILRGVEDGNFDFEWVSLERMEQIYGKVN